MFSEELNKLIETALVDEKLTNKKKGVIMKCTIAEGADPDEVELLLDAEMHKIQRATKENAKVKFNKAIDDGDLSRNLRAYNLHLFNLKQFNYVKRSIISR